MSTPYESGELRALKMLAKHGSCVVSSATTEPGEGTRTNRGYPTISSSAVDVIDLYSRSEPRVLVKKIGSRKWATLTEKGVAWCRAEGMEVREA